MFLNLVNRNFELDPAIGQIKMLSNTLPSVDGGPAMKKYFFAFSLGTLLLTTTVAAQTNSKPSAKAVVSGKVSEDRKTLIGYHSSWFVSNPDLLAGLEGRLVKVKCRLSVAAHEILILSVRPADYQTYAANRGDSAFRR
jgi:hypothetical protein